MQHNILRTTGLMVMALASLLTPMQAQTFSRRPAQHNAEHQDLLAYQNNIDEQIKLKETLDYLDGIFEEEEEPEMDIYTEGWDSQLVNPFAAAEVPNQKVIDVSNFAMPTPGYVTSPYGYRPRFRRMHKGIDLKVQIGDTIRAAFDGKVRITKFERKGYGYYVIVRHENGLETVYGHLSKFLVRPDEYVRAGDPIALGGNTGRSTGPHLHFETRFMGYAINPAAIFDFANQTTHTDLYTFNKSTYQNVRDYSPRSSQSVVAQKSSSKSKSSSSSLTVTIRRGDTLSKLAKVHGTTIERLCALNGISRNSKLTAGKKLQVR